MPRRVEDIIPNDRRSIRNVEKKKHIVDDAKGEEIRIKRVPIAPPPTHTPTHTRAAGIDKPTVPEHAERAPHQRHKRSGRGLRVTLSVVGALIVLGFIGYTASSYFARAVFTLTPREVPVTINSTYIAMATPDQSSLLYTLTSVGADESLTVPATDGQKIESKASGTATFYNAYTATPWRLIAGTRIVNDAGKVYRLTSSISIPGYTKSTSGSIVPGFVNAIIVADQSGAEYNATRDASAQPLAVAAYAGTSKYASIYAKLSTDIKGGFSGNKKTISPAVMASTTSALQSRLASELSQKIKAGVPAGYIVYDQAMLPSYGTPLIADNGPSTATVSLHGTVTAVLLKKNDLILKLAGSSAVQSFGGLAFEPKGLDQLSFAITNAKDFSPAKKNTLVLRLKGNMKLVGSIPVEELKIKFAGVSLSETQKIIQSLSPVIDLTRSGGQVVPPWSKIPSDPDKISIIVQE